MANGDYQAQKLFNLDGLVAVVTGGGTGIGYMITKGLAENGAKVYITGRRKEVLEKVANSGAIQGTVIPYASGLRLGLSRAHRRLFI